jgi:hypothetical protein
VIQTTRAKLLGVSVALLALALLSGRASPGFPLAGVAAVPKAVQRTISHALKAAKLPPARRPAQPPADQQGASAFAVADIPRRYLELYTRAAGACRALTWQVLAGIGKVETDHGRSPAAGVRGGVNSAGCCAGPMQFNIRNGPPSTWDGWGDGVLAHVYDPAFAIPAAARKLCGDGLASPQSVGPDPCPQVSGSAALHVALMRYNHACWYAHEVVTLAQRYTGRAAAAPPAPSGDPFIRALLRDRNLSTTTSRGCNPAPDLASGRLDLRVQSIVAVIAEHWRIRVSCVYSGHSTYVKGTTRVSNHHVWRAVDIDMVDGVPVSPGSASARSLVQWLDGLEGPLRPSEIGSPFPLGHRPYFTDEGHQGHVHIGYGAAGGA